MASLAFDTLQYARKLKAAGVPQAQAEAQAEAMGEAFGFYVDNLVTRDYMRDYIDARFAEQDARIDRRFAEVSGELKLLKWMLALVVVSTVVPALNSLFSWI